MKVFFIALATLAFVTPSLARNVVVKDGSGAYSCQKPNGEVVSYFWPAGRVPTSAEQLQCQQSGGRIQDPVKPIKATPIKTKSN